MNDRPTHSDRPDPDALLLRVQDESARAGRAKLKIFFGFAPGVGKTYAMLEAARRLRAQGRDVVVGYVETHGRSETAAMLGELEILQRARSEYRGAQLEELDLEAALARKPELLLLDELAHTNAPGSRHPKRYQDVLELLDAGIDVHTTLNVQHVESLNDTVAQVTRVHVRETVPDALLDRADEIELIDVSPDDLLARLRAGQVYVPEQASRAAQNFFQRGNLLALRELALRRVAERVDAEMQSYRSEHSIQSVWPAGERILVCVSPSPASAQLLRAATRMAAGLHAPWLAVYIERTHATPLSDDDRGRLDAHLSLASSLGAEVVRLSGTQVSDTLLAYARRRNVTRIIVGKPTHARIRDRLRGSLLDEIVRGSGAIDVHVILGQEDKPRPTPPPTAAGRDPGLAVYLWPTLMVALATGVAGSLRTLLALPDLVMVYLLMIMLVAIRFGRGPSVFAAALSVAAYDFFFVPPRMTFAVSDSRHLLTFAMMFGIGLLISSLTLRIRHAERNAEQREARTAAFYSLSRELASAVSELDVCRTLAAHVADFFATVATVYPLGEHSERLPEVSAGGAVHDPSHNANSDANTTGVVAWAIEHGKSAGLGTDTLPGASVLCVPLMAAERVLAVLTITPRERRALHVDERDTLDTFVRQATLAIERARLSETAKRAALRARTEEMRSSLLSAVSHDLRTPLGAITGAATLLRDTGLASPEAARELLDTLCEEAERLERLVGNLLEMTRLEAGIEPKRELIPLEELIGSALNRLEARLGKRPIHVELPNDLPLLAVDPVLFEQVFINLLENAAKYTPPDSALELRARADERELCIELEDHGPGIAKNIEDKLFDKFQRGQHVGVGGAGLGLPIVRGIVEAHGGSIDARNTGHGALFLIRLPRSHERELSAARAAIPLPSAESTS